jgi:hypothetical protein
MKENHDERPRTCKKFCSSRFAMLAAAVAMMAAAASESASSSGPATVVVAARDSSARSKALADHVCDGTGDQQEINAAIKALPEVGGTVLLMEGTYDIRKVAGKLGGIIIDRSNVVLSGQGASTKLIQAPDQDTNVIRIIGSGVGHITIRDLYIDANRDKNSRGAGDPNISHDRFEFCGIKAYYREPRGPAGGEPNHDITVRSTYVLNAHTLGIMLEGSNMKVVDNFLGNATSDSVEILTGPGEIRGNYVEITGRTHVAIGSDRGDSIIMAGNIVRVKKGGDIDIAFRSWAGSSRHIIANNVVTVDPGGKCSYAVDVRGSEAAITGNCLHTSNPNERLRLRIAAGNVVVTGNVLQNVVIELDDQTAEQKPIIIENNIMQNSTIDHKRGNLIAPRAAAR